MNLLYFLYFALPNFEVIGFPGKAINRLMLFVLKRVFDLIMPFYYKRTMSKAEPGINKEKRNAKITARLCLKSSL